MRLSLGGCASVSLYGAADYRPAPPSSRVRFVTTDKSGYIRSELRARTVIHGLIALESRARPDFSWTVGQNAAT